MKENMLEVLMYLFEQHLRDQGYYDHENDLIKELRSAGFDVTDIMRTLTWINGLSSTDPFIHKTSSAVRILSADEAMCIPPECWGLICNLEQIGILDFVSREVVIDRLIALADQESIDASATKWVALMVLLHLKGPDNALDTLEKIILGGESQLTH